MRIFPLISASKNATSTALRMHNSNINNIVKYQEIYRIIDFLLFYLILLFSINVSQRDTFIEKLIEESYALKLIEESYAFTRNYNLQLEYSRHSQFRFKLKLLNLKLNGLNFP